MHTYTSIFCRCIYLYTHAYALHTCRYTVGACTHYILCCMTVACLHTLGPCQVAPYSTYWIACKICDLIIVTFPINPIRTCKIHCSNPNPNPYPLPNPYYRSQILQQMPTAPSLNHVYTTTMLFSSHTNTHTSCCACEGCLNSTKRSKY